MRRGGVDPVGESLEHPQWSGAMPVWVRGRVSREMMTAKLICLVTAKAFQGYSLWLLGLERERWRISTIHFSITRNFFFFFGNGVDIFLILKRQWGCYGSIGIKMIPIDSSNR